MAGQKYLDKRTKLPQSLLEEINAKDDLASSAPPRRGRPVDRKTARKEKRDAGKVRKSQFFTKSKEPGPSVNLVKKRPGDASTERPSKKVKLGGESGGVVYGSGKEAKSSVSQSKTPTIPKSATALERATPKPSTSKPSTTSKSAPTKPPPTKTKQTPLERLVVKPKKREKDAEDDEIAWLEAKLGLSKRKRKKASYGGAFSADGLDDILADLDRFEEDVFGVGASDEEDWDELGSGDEEGEGEGEEPEASGEDKDTASDEGSESADSQEGTQDDPDSDSESEEAPTLIEHKSEEEDSKADAPASGKALGAYVPPHLRQKAPSDETGSTQTPEQIKLVRQLKGHLNRLSEQNIEAIVGEVEALYRSNPRNDVTQALTTILLNSVSSSANLLDTFVILHAAFVAAIHKIIGIEFAAYFVEQAVSSYETHWKSLHTLASGTQSLEDGPTGTKESSNLLVLLSELYNFQVISCVLVYDLIRALLNSEFSEHDVELLLKVVKNSGQQMRQDDPLALKDIIQLVQDKMRGKNENQLSSRFRFMVETLINLKNNKLKDARRSTGTGQNVAAEAIEKMKKYLGGINKKRHVMSHEPLRVSLEDLHSSSKRGKWWLVGSAWGGNPLVENQAAKIQAKNQSTGPGPKGTSTAQVTEQLMQLARQHGMNTEVRRNIFVVLMSSDDYVDACERLTQLDLQEIQQREIMRVVLHCCGNERTYNPFYTLVAHHLCQKSHSHRITLQYCLWDFLRTLGEIHVGGEAISREFADSGSGNVSDSTITNYAKAYAWWLARGSIALTILKASPVEFLTLQPRSKQFFKTLFLQMVISSQSNSPLIDVRSAESSIPQIRDRAAIEDIVSKALRLPALCKGVAYSIHSLLSEEKFQTKSRRAHELLVWGLKVAKEALQRGDTLSDDDL